MKIHLLGIAAALTLFVSQGSMAEEKKLTGQEIMARVEKAIDPENKSKDIKTQVTKFTMLVPMQGMKFNGISKFKAPGMNVTKVELPGMMKTIQCFDGENAWEFSNLQGLRKISGKELNFVKLNTALESPINTFRDVFSSTELQGTEKIEGSDCYKIVCTPKKDFKIETKITVWIEKKTFYPKQLSLVAQTQRGAIPSKAISRDFKKINGKIYAMETTLYQLGSKMVIKLESVESNVKLDDKDFDIKTYTAAPETAANAK